MGLATAEAGAAVVLADFNGEAVKAAAETLPAAGHRAVAFEVVSSKDWAEKVDKPDIVNTSAKLYKTPGDTT